jgi:hypothetical protein
LYEAASVVHALLEAGLIEVDTESDGGEQAATQAADDDEWVVDDEPSDAELADSVERVRRALASMLEPDAEPDPDAYVEAYAEAEAEVEAEAPSRTLAELVAEEEARDSAGRKGHLRVVEDDGQRRRREAEEIAAEVEAARL